jgi:hypothetical protein
MAKPIALPSTQEHALATDAAPKAISSAVIHIRNESMPVATTASPRVMIPVAANAVATPAVNATEQIKPPTPPIAARDMADVRLNRNLDTLRTADINRYRLNGNNGA